MFSIEERFSVGMIRVDYCAFHDYNLKTVNILEGFTIDLAD